jgi:Ca2+/Na+ antiporter
MKNSIDILAILLPALIILMGLLRLFSHKKNVSVYNGFIMLAAIILLLLGITRYVFYRGNNAHNNEPRPQPLAVSKHSEAFNQSVQNMLTSYYRMTEAFVNWDTAQINASGNELKTALDSLKINELQKDSLIYLTALDPLSNAKAEITSIIADPAIDEKRASLNLLSDNLRSLLTTIKYDQSKIYWQECPMAFGDDKPGNWLSKTIEVRNPYLGTKGPSHGNEMLNCGGPKDTINFMTADTTKK